MDTGLLFLCFIPVIIFLSSWGFGSMISAMATVRGQNAKALFWISAILYASFTIAVVLLDLYVENVVNDYDVTQVLIIIFYLIVGVGVLVAPIVGLVIRRRNPELFKKPVANNTPQPSNIPVSPKPQPVVKKTQSPIVETNIQPKAESVTSSAIKPKFESSHIFVSYRRSDSADIAGRIYDRLIGKFGKGPVFKDVDSIPLGLDFKEYLDMKVGECDVFLAIIGNEWLTARDSAGNRRLDDPTDFVRIEIESALQRKIPVIPLLVRDAHMPLEADLPPSLRKLVFRNGTPIRSDPDFHRDMDRLIAALEKYITKDES